MMINYPTTTRQESSHYHRDHIAAEISHGLRLGSDLSFSSEEFSQLTSSIDPNKELSLGEIMGVSSCGVEGYELVDQDRYGEIIFGLMVHIHDIGFNREGGSNIPILMAEHIDTYLRDTRREVDPYTADMGRILAGFYPECFSEDSLTRLFDEETCNHLTEHGKTLLTQFGPEVLEPSLWPSHLYWSLMTLTPNAASLPEIRFRVPTNKNGLYRNSSNELHGKLVDDFHFLTAALLMREIKRIGEDEQKLLENSFFNRVVSSRGEESAIWTAERLRYCTDLAIHLSLITQQKGGQGSL